MQHLEVTDAVRPLKWPLGVKWLRQEVGSRIFLPMPTTHLPGYTLTYAAMQYYGHQYCKSLTDKYIALQFRCSI